MLELALLIKVGIGSENLGHMWEFVNTHNALLV